jgi:hypothetical protein
VILNVKVQPGVSLRHQYTPKKENSLATMAETKYPVAILTGLEKDSPHEEEICGSDGMDKQCE